MTKILCPLPYSYLEVSNVGDLRCCCDAWCSFYKFGNILKESISDILNNESTKLFLEQFKTQNFKYCNLDICPMAEKVSDEEFEKKYLQYSRNQKPLLRLNFDTRCNVKCIFCRPIDYTVSKESIEQYDKMNETIQKELFYANENHWGISLNGVGEVFANKTSIEIIKTVVKKYPNISFGIITNGILCSKRMLKNLKIEDRILSLEVSIHSFKEETYKRIVLNGNFKKVKENLLYLSKLHNEGKIKYFYLNFVITSYNYKEMEDFINYAWKLGAIPNFLPLLHLPNISLDLFNELNITDKNHPEYSNFVEMIKNPIFHSGKIIIPSSFLNLE